MYNIQDEVRSINSYYNSYVSLACNLWFVQEPSGSNRLHQFGPPNDEQHRMVPDQFYADSLGHSNQITITNDGQNMMFPDQYYVDLPGQHFMGSIENEVRSINLCYESFTSLICILSLWFKAFLWITIFESIHSGEINLLTLPIRYCNSLASISYFLFEVFLWIKISKSYIHATSCTEYIGSRPIPCRLNWKSSL